VGRDVLGDGGAGGNRALSLGDRSFSTLVSLPLAVGAALSSLILSPLRQGVLRKIEGDGEAPVQAALPVPVCLGTRCAVGRRYGRASSHHGVGGQAFTRSKG